MVYVDCGIHQEASINIPFSAIPKSESIFFKDSSFFKNGHSLSDLPSPAEVRHQSGVQPKGRREGILPAHFPSLNLVVKYGRSETIAEGQCLWTIKRLLGECIPVPEVYGWCKDSGYAFIYMERIQGDTLEERWDTMTSTEKNAISEQLRGMVQSLRSLRQDVGDPFIGGIARQPLEEIMFEGREQVGPFGSVRELHDWWANLANQPHPDLANFVDPMRSLLDDSAPIRFTHSDLHPSNIMIRSDAEGRPQVCAIIDWHQSGWYPANWEYAKTLLTVSPDTDWAKEYVPRFLTCPDSYEGRIANKYYNLIFLRLDPQDPERAIVSRGNYDSEKTKYIEYLGFEFNRAYVVEKLRAGSMVVPGFRLEDNGEVGDDGD